MEFISYFFISLSTIIIAYLFILFKTGKRMGIFFEIFSIGTFFIVILLLLFPKILIIIEKIFGIDSAINFITYSSIFLAYFLIFNLYKKSEDQRVEITKLIREIAFLNYKKKK